MASAGVTGGPVGPDRLAANGIEGPRAEPGCYSATLDVVND